jgi:heme o synthase
MQLPAATTVGSSAERFSLAALFEMTKPRVTRMVLITTALGGAVAPGHLNVSSLLLTLLGTSLIVAAANVLNMFLEQDSDSKMERTRERPLPTGRVSPELALGFGVVLAIAGISTLSLFVNALAGELAMMAFVSYVLVYTPLKAVSQLALYVGAVPGALPPLLGYAGQYGALSAQAWSLFWLLFAWQLPHFLAIAIFRRDDYARAGLQVMPVVSGLQATRRAIIALSCVLVLVSAAPLATGLGGT